jgi:hypothetical protein
VVLDEAANIAPLRDLDTLASTAAGQGIQLVSVFQDLAQISARYGERAATVVNNHRAKVLLSGISDPPTSSMRPACSAMRRSCMPRSREGSAANIQLRSRPATGASRRRTY